eukprot:gene23798-25368_t
MTAMLVELGHEVLAYRDGGEALRQLLHDPDIDVLMTSLETPTVDGLQLCWEARTLERPDRPIYVIAMSSSRDRDQLSKALDSGADDFIAKPPAVRELSARLRSASRMLTAQTKLLYLASHDPLSDLFNRRAFFERAGSALSRANETSADLAVLMIDIDHFKQVNDTFGHDVGDRVIAAVAGQIRKVGELGGRMGGEEFAVVLENTSQDAAARRADELRRDLAGGDFDGFPPQLRVSVSIGVAGMRPGDTLSDVLKRADLALYQAKRSGRNCVVVSSPGGSQPADARALARAGDRKTTASAA